MTRPVPFLRVLSLGVIVGAALGAIGGLAESLLSPLGTAVRWPFTVGANGLLGGGWGLLVALPVALTPAGRRGGLPRAGGWIFALAGFPLLAAALGLLANRVLLSGTHFLSPVSLVADGIALGVAGLLSAGVGRIGRAALGGSGRGPGPGFALLALLVLTAGYLLPGLVFRPGRPDPSRPDLVLVSIDTLRPDRLSAGGEPRGTSPHIDRLAREGIQFSEALAASPGSAASHAALLTSRYPVSNGVWANFTVMDGSVKTLAEILHDDGYRTGGFVTNTFLGQRFHFDQGFDAYVESGLVERLDEPSPAVLRRSLGLVQIVDRIRVRLEPGYDPSFETALAWIRESNRPTLWFVHLMDVHSPYVPPHPYGPRFGADPTGGRGGDAPRNRFGWRPSEEAYVAEIRFADAKIGRLRRTLEELARLDESLVILTSDHGENLLDHEPNFSHGETLYDATLRILATIRAPAFDLRTRVEPIPLENIDLLPTLFAILERDPGADWQGRSFWPSAPQPRATVAQLNRDFAIRTRDSKLVLGENGAREWYRLDEDPGERRLSSLPPAKRRELEQALEAWIAAHATPLWADARSIAPGELSPELREKLEALGYLE